ncbi:hypothetical protein CK203_048257 [Vitis vinifera]|uniref:Uncharacterized protein n=1 Tax=Vitis vinifera TaxID=29760 RepID=A0A438H0N2_VITVI|nr:hypothetical protein CK203_048257 [Vitis vinifera]
MALFSVEDGIARRLWPDFFPIDSKGKNPSEEQRPNIVDSTPNFTLPRTSYATRFIGRPSTSIPKALQKLMNVRLLTSLEPKPLSQPIPPQFRMDLYCSYHQRQGHDTNWCTALRHAIQDVIDWDSINLDHLVSIPSIDHVDDDNVQMMRSNDTESEPIILD